MIRDDTAMQNQSLIAATAAVAAAAGAMTGSADPTPQPQRKSAETLKRELNSEKVRTENRERKKRWREQNEERNKDNDLRCRVNKRANSKFGKHESEAKTRWIEEEFSKRQMKRKEKERRRNPDAVSPQESLSASPKSTILTELAMHQHHQPQLTAVQQQLQQHVDQHFHAAQLAHPHFDPTTVKTALALSDLVKKNGSHIDLAQLTGVLTDPNLQQQLNEIEKQNPSSRMPPASTAMMVMNAPVKPEHEIKSGGHILEADYPMDAVLTLMQLNGSWKA
ncbi:hypothetical protein BX616_002754 [Lobosporangium transversale]|uniref:DUF3020 domain-containing protein n=1 Tax=Lobosporangium transversale TaxID=64571 RepID=A0A1Y2GW81_9FUNG|nr:hypothetical protein BCR41DRAFT_347530 [Lobosporangium transversale]KAF9899977.1 hypothetical protein BX616_002754 [Lobosporangium transversale]ORZ26558.1 hypothetical protein BCR41DRAFT_347530 [Lobosporangium transversale]|eukprot:XP_021884321.1 hypothetical protein BCR41DRAFT_347530 [Lobosporangium transversale]